MIEARYTLTFDDFREANGLPPMESTQTRWARWKLLAWVLVVGAVATVFFFLHQLDRRQRALAQEPFPFVRLLLTMAPALGLCMLFAFIMFRVNTNPPLKPWLLPPPEARKKKNPPPNTFGRSLLGWCIFVGLALILFMLRDGLTTPRAAPGGPGGDASTRLPLTFDFLLPLVPIFFLLVVIGVFAGLSSKRRLPRMWESMRHEQQPRTLRADAEALLIEQASATQRYDWEHFAGYKETKNLLLVYLSPYSFHMIPKRAFATPADLDAFKGLLMSGIPEGTFLPTERAAFPVVPMATMTSSPADS